VALLNTLIPTAAYARMYSQLWRCCYRDEATASVCSAVVSETVLRANIPIVTNGSLGRAVMCGATNMLVKGEAVFMLIIMFVM
jgi:hypothetical protein